MLLLVRDRFTREADEFVATLPAEARARASILLGDASDMDLGLAGGEYKRLTEELTAIHHTASLYHVGHERAEVARVNVKGTRTALDLGAECGKLRRFVHWSTAQVSGLRSGVILEEELDCGQRFRNPFEETKFEAELLARDFARRIPVTVVRPGIIVGDSKTGEIDRHDGPYHLLTLILSSPLDVHLPLPGRGAAPLNIVPVDFVVEAASSLAKDPRAAGGTFHLTDPCPFSSRTVYELVAQRAEKKGPRGFIPMAPMGLTRALLRAPGLERLTRGARDLIDAFNHVALYNARHAMALLDQGVDGKRIQCPPFDSYVGPLVHHVRDLQAARKRRIDEETPDPFG